MKQHLQLFLSILLLTTLAACRPAPAPSPTPAAASTQPTATAAGPTATDTATPTAAPNAAQANCPGDKTDLISEAQTALGAFESTMDVPATVDLRDRMACWLNSGGDLATLETALTESLTQKVGDSRFTQADLTGDGRDETIALIPAMGLPLLVFVEQNDLYRGFALPPQSAEPLPTWLRDLDQGQLPDVEQSAFELIDLTGDGQPEITINYSLPGGSGFSLFPVIYQWRDNDFQPVFAAQLITWAGASTMTFAPDETNANRQEIVLTYPYLYGQGFDHKLVNHPVARQIWRWKAEARQFIWVSEVVDLTGSAWGAESPITVEDRLRWRTNEGEAAFRIGDYATTLDRYNQVLTEAAAESWQPEAEQPNWPAYAAFRRGETLLLQGQPDSHPPDGFAANGVAALQAVAAAYPADILSQLAQSLLDGYGDGRQVDAAAWAIAAMQPVDLYSHFYFGEPGALIFPMDAAGILYPGAGLAAYVNAQPVQVDDSAALQTGLAAAGFKIEAVAAESDQIHLDLRLPEAPNADGQLQTWTLIRDEGGWRVALPSAHSEPWPMVGGF